MIVKVLLTLIVIVNGVFAITLIRDIAAHKEEVRNEPAGTVPLAFSSFVTFFLSTFGISDFAISTVLYRKLGWTTDKKLPGTLNAQSVLPVAVMALAYISTIEVELKTLIVCIACQVAGAYIGPKFVMKLDAKVIKRFISVGLLVAAAMILLGKFGILPTGGDATGVSGLKLVILGFLIFIYGALNNIGIGSYALTMATVYAFGLNPGVTFPLMMGGCTFAVPIGSMQFIKHGEYSRKITMFTSTIGLLGVLVAVFIVKNLDVSKLQWLVAGVLIYSAISMIKEILKEGQVEEIEKSCAPRK